MISYDKGKVQICGNVIILCYEMECLIREFRNNLINSLKGEKAADEQLELILRFARQNEEDAEKDADQFNKDNPLPEEVRGEFEKLFGELEREMANE